ncbi:MAG: glycosyltransferase family 87 protein, partial [Anaerolineae bacterium]
MLDQRNDRWLTHLATGLALLALLFFALTVVRPLARLHTDGFAGYYTIGHIAVYTPEQLALAYDEAWYGPQVVLLTAPGVREVFKNQPPPGSLLLAPLVWLPYPTARLVWLLLNLGFLVVSLMLLARAVRWPARAGLWIAPLCLLYRPVYENLRQGQMYLWLLVWLCLALWALATGPARPRAYALGGVMLGLLLIFKTAVIWLWPLLALARRWQILLWGGITAAAVALLSLFY